MKNGKNIIITIFGIISSFTCLSQNIPFGALPLDITVLLPAKEMLPG
jgi:hypothetical protein